MDAEKNARHKARMQKKKTLIDDSIAAAAIERGVLLVHTGNGKGKSSAAFGLLARALGHGLKCAVVQFIKSRADTGEEAFFRRQPLLEWHVGGAGFTWDTQDDARDQAAARAAWAIACRHLRNAEVGLLVLDEFTYALNYGWIEFAEVAAALTARPALQHVVITGRAASAELIALADTVTDMSLVKHAYQAGIKAMPGLEW